MSRRAESPSKPRVPLPPRRVVPAPRSSTSGDTGPSPKEESEFYDPAGSNSPREFSEERTLPVMTSPSSLGRAGSEQTEPREWKPEPGSKQPLRRNETRSGPAEPGPHGGRCCEHGGRCCERRQVGAMTRRDGRAQTQRLLNRPDKTSAPRWGRAPGENRWIQAQSRSSTVVSGPTDTAPTTSPNPIHHWYLGRRYSRSISFIMPSIGRAASRDSTSPT